MTECDNRPPPADSGALSRSTYESHEFGRLPTQELSCCCRGEAAELAHRSNPAGPKRGDLFGCELIKLFEREPSISVFSYPESQSITPRGAPYGSRYAPPRASLQCQPSSRGPSFWCIASLSSPGPIQWRRWRPQRTLSRAPRRSLRQDRFIRRRPLPSLGESSQRTIDAIGERNQVVEPPRGRRIEETLDGHMDHGSLARHRRTGPDRAQWTLPPSLPFAQPTFE